MGLLGSLGQVAYDIIANDGTGTGSAAAQKNMMAVGAAMTGVGVASKLMVDDVNQSFLGFDKSTTAVKALGVLSEEEFQRAKNAAIDMSTQMPISATDVSDAMYSMISVGYDYDTMMSTMPEAAKLAVGGNQAFKTSVDTVINVMGAYGDGVYSAAEITNILAKGVGVGKWELNDFTTEIMKNIGVGAQLGISFEDLAAANVLLQTGFTSSEEAGTALKTMLMRLVDPKVQADLEALGVNVKDDQGNFVGLESILNQLEGALGNMGGQSSALGQKMSALGITVFDGNGKFVGMSTVVNELNNRYSRTGELTPELKAKIEALGFKVDEKTGKFSLSSKTMKDYDEILSATGGDVDKMSALQTIFGTEGIRAAMVLVNQKDKLKETSAQMDDSSYKEQAFNTVVESTGSKLEIATNKMEAAKIQLGEGMAPATIIAADAMGLLAGVISGLPEPLQGVAGMALYAAQGFAALGPALMGLAALKGLGLGGIFTSIGTAISGLGTTITTTLVAAISSVPGMLAAGIALGLAGAWVLLETGVLDWLSGIGRMIEESDLGNLIMDILQIVLAPVGSLGNLIIDIVSGNWDLSQIVTDMASPFETAINNIESIMGRIPGALGSAFSDITTAFSALGGSVQQAFTSLFTGISDFIVGLAQGFVSAGYNIIMFIVQGMQSAAGAVGSAISGILGIIGQYIPHSPAETGPLSQLPNFQAYFVDPLLAVTPAVQSAAVQVAAAATLPAAAAETTTNSTSTTTTDNSVSIGNVNASKDYSISDIMTEIASMQALKRTQRGISSG